MVIARALEQAAQKARLSDVQIAAAVGVSQGAVSRWRRGQRSPRGSHLIKLFAVVPGFFELVDITSMNARKKKAAA